jgi:hypothetical protein
MNRRLIAGVLLAVLAILGGLDFFEDAGLIEYSTSEMDRSVEDALDNYGEAIRPATQDTIGSLNLNTHDFSQPLPSSWELNSGNRTQAIQRKGKSHSLIPGWNPFDHSQVFLA